MNRVVEILMKRDNMTEKEANDLLDVVRNDIDVCLADGDYDGVEDVIASMLGLEPDYIPDIIGM